MEGDYETEDPTMIERLKPVFDKLAGEDEVVSAKELLVLLKFICKAVSKEKPDLSHAYALMSLFDQDNSGKLDFHEFLKLYRFFTICRAAFSKVSQDGNADSAQLERGLKLLKVMVPRKVISVALHRYGDKKCHVSYGDFLAIVCKVKTVMDICEEDPSGIPMSVLEKLLCATLVM